jgi:uncharacterized membrane protein YkoI
LALTSIGATAAIATGAFALAGESNDALAAPRPSVSLAAAATAAEQHAGGYATQAEYEKTKAGWAYDVEVVSGARVLDVRVDAASGKVLSSQQDAADTDEEDGEDQPD